MESILNEPTKPLIKLGSPITLILFNWLTLGVKGGIVVSTNKGKKKKNKNKEELNEMKGGKERHRRNRS